MREGEREKCIPRIKTEEEKKKCIKMLKETQFGTVVYFLFLLVYCSCGLSVSFLNRCLFVWLSTRFFQDEADGCFCGHILKIVLINKMIN